MNKSTKYQGASNNVETLGAVVPNQLVEDTTKALSKLKNALGGDVSGYVAHRLHMNLTELRDSLAAEQVDGVALAMYNIEKRAQAVIIGDQTGIGKGRQAAAMIRYGLLSGYLPVFFTDRYTLFSDMYRDCKALGIKDARPLIVNAGTSVVDFDHVIENDEEETPSEIWSPACDVEEDTHVESQLMQIYKKQYEVVYKAPKKKILDEIFKSGDIPTEAYDYLMMTYSQLKDAQRDMTRLNFLRSLCKKHRVLFVFDEAHRSSSVSAGKISVITQSINLILSESTQTQCVFLSATFAKRPENFITFMRRTALKAIATEDTLDKALHSGGVPMQEYVSSCLAAEGQMIRREHSNVGLPATIYTYLDDDLALHSELFDKVMYFFREIVSLSTMVHDLVHLALTKDFLDDFKCYPTRAQLFYINKVLLLSLKAEKVAQVAIDEVRQGRSVVIGMSDTLECVLQDVVRLDDELVRGDISSLLLRLMEKTVRSTNKSDDSDSTIFDRVKETGDLELLAMSEQVIENYKYLVHSIKDEVFHLPMSPIDVIRQLVTKEKFTAPDGSVIHIRFEECTGRAHQLEYLSPEGDDEYIHARVIPRKKRHSNRIFNDFQNNKLDIILINACGAIGASAHASATAEVPDAQVRQRKMLIVQNDLDVNIDLQKRGRINRTGQRADLPPLYEYIITAIPSEKRLNMMLRAKLRSLSANITACQDQNKELADFVDISNKYGNDIASDYIDEHPGLAAMLGLKGTTSASKLLARIAMLGVTAQQDIIDDLMTAYTSLEAELRRVNQWDLEREFRDFEAEYVRDELFTTGKKAETKFGGCSYLTIYKCKQKTFPYTFASLMESCEEAKTRFGNPYNDNPALQREIRGYYTRQNKAVRERYEERRTLLHASAKRILVKYCMDDALAEAWLTRAHTPSDSWDTGDFADVNQQKYSKQINRKLISYSNEYNKLLNKEKRDLHKIAAEKKRLVAILSMAEIGNGYYNVREQLASDECPGRVIAVLRDIRFGKEERNKFMPGRVEFVFALSAVFTEIRINLVHNNKWSNYDRLHEILVSRDWMPNADIWDREIAYNNSKIVVRQIITGNILGAFVHPAIAELQPRFISFSIKTADADKPKTQNGLLLPMDDSKIRELLKTVSIPLHEGLKYANNTNTSYTITGVGVDFSLLPYRVSEKCLKFVLSVRDDHSKRFEEDKRFDNIRDLFTGSVVTSIYDKKESGRKRVKSLMHYQTEQLEFDAEPLQVIIQVLVRMDAVIIVPRDQLTYGEAKEFVSRSERDDNEPWPALDWRNADAVPMPPVAEKLLVRISAPIVPRIQKGRPVLRHSEQYRLAQETMSYNGSMFSRKTLDALRDCYLKWKDFNLRSAENKLWDNQRISKRIINELQRIIENKSQAAQVEISTSINMILQHFLDGEYLDTDALYQARFDNEMVFLSPNKDDAQAFLDNLPCSSGLAGIRKCIQDYIDGKTDIICSP